MNILTRWLPITALLLLSLNGPSVFAKCSVDDFRLGASPGIVANACFSSDAKNNEMESLINSTWSREFTQLSKYEREGGTESGSLNVSPINDGPGFNWSMDTNAFADIGDAVFVVKQGNANASGNPNRQGGNRNKPVSSSEEGGISWVAYLFNNVSNTLGSFFSDSGFVGENDYSHVSVYGAQAQSVPEIDTASTGIVFSLLLALVALFRERRRTH